MKHFSVGTNPQRNTWVIQIGPLWFGWTPAKVMLMIFWPKLFVRLWDR